MRKAILFSVLLFLLISISVNALGDVNSDGKIGSSDYILVRKYLLGTSSLNSNQLKEADMNGDNKINATDYILIRKSILNGKNIEPTPTATPSPTPTPKPIININGYPYKYKDSTADLTIEKKEYNSNLTGKKTVYYQTHLVITDYSRLHTALTSYVRNSDGTYNTRMVSTAANEVGAILALEGDYRLNSSYGTVRDSVYYSSKSLDPTTINAKKGCYAYYNKLTGVLDDCNNLKSKTIADAINSKELTDTFRFAKNLLVNGVNQSSKNANSAHRQANFVGYVKPGEFYFIVSEGAAYSDSDKPSDGSSYGLTAYDRGELLKSLGCTFGAQLDGGQSVIVWFMGKKLHSLQVIKNERDWLTDYVYFK